MCSVSFLDCTSVGNRLGSLTGTRERETMSFSTSPKKSLAQSCLPDLLQLGSCSAITSQIGLAGVELQLFKILPFLVKASMYQGNTFTPQHAQYFQVHFPLINTISRKQGKLFSSCTYISSPTTLTIIYFWVKLLFITAHRVEMLQETSCQSHQKVWDMNIIGKMTLNIIVNGEVSGVVIYGA